ncbi:hypothetical protein Tco_1519218, partial [Tanacetum coccineum]
TTTHLLLVHLRILRLEMYHLDYVTLRGEHHDVVRHSVIGVLLHYLLCIHRLHQSHHQEIHQRGPCIYLDSVPSSTPVMGSLAPTRADLLPPCKRFRDSYSSEASIEEDTEIDPIETEVDMELGIGDGDDVRYHVEIDPIDVKDDTE